MKPRISHAEAKAAIIAECGEPKLVKGPFGYGRGGFGCCGIIHEKDESCARKLYREANLPKPS